MSPTRILMATDVPFWRCETGAQQRMLHLVLGIADEQFGARACKLQTFFIGVASAEDQQQASALGLDVRFHTSDRPPDGIRKRIKWHMEGTIHLVRQTFRGRDDVAEVDQPMQLRDFFWPWAIDAFADCIDAFNPDAILCQYVTMGYLLEALNEKQRSRIKCIVDTHDVLSSRQEQFEQFGYAHWISIDANQESIALQKFDAALAIIDSERPTFQTMAPNVDVLTVGHSLDPITRRHIVTDQPANAPFTVGYFGSSNHSNGHALIKFVRQVWQPIRQQNADIRLVIAGSICDWLMFHEESRFSSEESMSLWIELSTDSNVTLLGKIDSAEDFYQRIDVAINPVEFGTGLKIKTCEALAYGVPSVITKSCSAAVPPEIVDCIFATESVREMAPTLLSLTLNHDQLGLARDAARSAAQNIFNNKVAYGGLVDWLSRDGVER